MLKVKSVLYFDYEKFRKIVENVALGLFVNVSLFSHNMNTVEKNNIV